jgi:hypothetical protein
MLRYLLHKNSSRDENFLIFLPHLSSCGTGIAIWTYDLYGPVCNAFYAGKSITRESGRGLGFMPLSLRARAQCSKFFLLHYPPPPHTRYYTALASAVNLNRKTYEKLTGNSNAPVHKITPVQDAADCWGPGSPSYGPRD